jgi:hypothetical protein
LDVKEGRIPFIHNVIVCIKRWNKADQVLLAAENDAVMGKIRRQIRDQNTIIATGFSYGEAEAFMQWVWRAKENICASGPRASGFPRVQRDETDPTRNTGRGPCPWSLSPCINLFRQSPP